MIYKINCSWAMTGIFFIEASSRQEAIEQAKISGLPDIQEYVNYSFGIDSIEEYEDEKH